MELDMVSEVCFVFMRDHNVSQEVHQLSWSKACAFQTSLDTMKMENLESELKTSSWWSSTQNTLTDGCLRILPLLLIPGS